MPDPDRFMGNGHTDCAHLFDEVDAMGEIHGQQKAVLIAHIEFRDQGIAGVDMALDVFGQVAADLSKGDGGLALPGIQLPKAVPSRPGEPNTDALAAGIILAHTETSVFVADG